jgi:hypothetical protein
VSGFFTGIDYSAKPVAHFTRPSLGLNLATAARRCWELKGRSRHFDHHKSVFFPSDTSTRVEILFDTAMDDMPKELALLPVTGIMRRTAHEKRNGVQTGTSTGGKDRKLFTPWIFLHYTASSE